LESEAKRRRRLPEESADRIDAAPARDALGSMDVRSKRCTMAAGLSATAGDWQRESAPAGGLSRSPPPLGEQSTPVKRRIRDR